MGALLTALGTAGVGSLIAGGLNLGSTLMTNLFNKNQSDQSSQLQKENLEWQKEQYFDQKAYNENLQKQLFQREDTSYQRTADDLQKAGYSPLAINGTNDAGTVVGNPSIPELGTTNPFQAQSLNFGQLADILGQADQRAIEREKLQIEEKKNLSDKQQKELDREQRKYETDIAWQQSQDQFTMSLQQQKSNDAKKNELIDTQIQSINKNLDALKQTMDMDNDRNKLDTLTKLFKQATGSDHGNFKFVPDDEVEKLQSDWQINFASYCAQNASSLLNDPESFSKAIGGKIGITLKGNGGDAGINNSESKSYDFSSAYDYLLKSYLATNAYPMPEKLRPSYY